MRAAGRLATWTLADTVGHVEHVHRAAASRVFALSAPASRPRSSPPRWHRHRRSTPRSGGSRWLPAWPAVNLWVERRGHTVAAGSTPQSNLAMAVLNATLGNELADQGSPLAIHMAVVMLPPSRRRPSTSSAGSGLSRRDLEGCGLHPRLRRNRGVLAAARRSPRRRLRSTYGSRLVLFIFGYTPRLFAVQHRAPHLREREAPHRCSSKMWSLPGPLPSPK